MASNRFLRILNGPMKFMKYSLGLKGYFKEDLSFARAAAIIKARMAQREENFLKIIKKGVFGYKKSPYLSLLKLCRCEYKDIERLVSRCGLEGALRTLKDDGVYIKIEEFKGKSPIIRKGRKFDVREDDFDNPYFSSYYERRSGGSRSAGTRIELNFDFLSDTAVHRGPISRFWNLEQAAHIIIRPPYPYGPGMMYMLQLSKFGIIPQRWISLIDERRIPISLRSRLGVSTTFFLSRIYGKQFPRPEFIDRNNIWKVAELIADYGLRYKECCVFTNVSSAFRICVAAKEKKINLNRVKFQGCGEPLTEAKRNLIESVGAKYILFYAFTEAGLVGSLCLKPKAIDDIHVYKDSVSLISHKKIVRDSQVDAILCTAVLPSAPKILLNVESGDYGILENRRCGCPYDEFGYSDHIHHIRSFEKLTGEGTTFYGTDLIRVIEEIFPQRFGGTGLDYQLVEQENKEGLTQLIILVSPKVGQIDGNKLIQTFIAELKKGNDSQRVMAETWSKAGTIQIKRDDPIITQAGKQYPLHILFGGKP